MAGTGRWRTLKQMDRDIARAVLATLEERGMLPHGKVWVAVNNGWVTLKGHVDGESQRAAAVALTSGQLGVRGVIDSITVASLNDPI